MTSIELQPFEEATTVLGETINASRIVQASQNSDVLPLHSGEDCRRMEVGIFVIPERVEGVMATGFIACRHIVEPPIGSPEPFKPRPDGLPTTYAIIGSLYLEPDLRGGDLAGRLVKHVTDLVFSEYQGIEACVATCNDRNAPAFILNGYNPTALARKLVTPASHERSLVLLYDDWAAGQASNHVQ